MGGCGIMMEVTYMLNWMPGVTLISKVCPKGVEATVFAIVAGFSNFGQMVSRCIGASLITLFSIKVDLTKGDMKAIDNNRIPCAKGQTPVLQSGIQSCYIP